ncbi:MAG: hypothetical protein A2600_13560 [Candidatus Lambdaproteobacteria bacterium RIFOXYD1_FULL_56_27]|uniref:GDP-mannose pyrophosphatase n=1 Tax=Candidatus Lambdaproteobacteria bacterium RIFOXYD2_FULL_56_26 TaxID=1817773 RepID=A0A1F6H014_9PROT|nr:MAG: hypothetical protein A2557_04110 [Candidatus Lambdaproteobacteria bacterium RIFOXYD2_FULL_56_26]OGH04236.1 MAG: hypothetical protein A2426_02520 [Candidatus Lambdaproteobacteria bacterium RIFOXYC1_FULL_56_13]OGH07760.1 MAG: hypothetical protein A2600_13560 [Candidatus Lambdaproteobacteria bacterium RIFOXYD1_FULL_56_27]
MDYKILENRRIFQEFFRVDRVTLVHDCFNGKPLEVVRYHLERPEVVAVILENTDRGTIVMVEQFRFSSVKTSKTNGWTLEIIGGLIDHDETPEACGKRESLEESGYRVKDLEYLTAFYPSFGVSDELVHLYYGQVTDQDKVEAGGGLAHEHEDLRVLEIPTEELLAKTFTGELTDAKSMIALLWLGLKKQQARARP